VTPLQTVPVVVPLSSGRRSQKRTTDVLPKPDNSKSYRQPDIFNTDQGSQFTGSAFTAVLANHGIAISMDGKGAWRDNVFVERLWRSVKYEEVYLRAYDSVSDARASIGRYLDFYNGRRPHSSLDGITPDHAYFTPLPLRLAA
jgi:putative transposase